VALIEKIMLGLISGHHAACQTGGDLRRIIDAMNTLGVILERAEAMI